MQINSVRRARPAAAALALAALITTGAACSSSSGTSAAKPSGSTRAASGATRASTAPAADTAQGTDGGPNPCTIVTAAEVQAILGAAASPSGPTDENRGTACKWHGNSSSLLVLVYHGKEFYSPEMQAPKATKLTGIGDDAYLDAFGTTRAGVGFLKGDIAVFLDGLQVTSPDAVVAAATDAASKV
jgi:Protein of unknown function (DUF3558)